LARVRVMLAAGADVPIAMSGAPTAAPLESVSVPVTAIASVTVFLTTSSMSGPSELASKCAMMPSAISSVIARRD
jgi:hypothetical protein